MRKVHTSVIEYVARGTVESMASGSRSEMWKIIAQNSVEQYEGIVRRVQELKAGILLALQPIPQAPQAEVKE